MATKMNQLAVIDHSNLLPIVPSAEDLAAIREELSDMDRVPYGRIKIAAGGVNIFQVFEPGEEEAVPAQTIEGVIMLSHKSNGLWSKPFGSGDSKVPDCSSIDGVYGTVTETGETGEIVECASCPCNAFGSAKGGEGRGKACKNMRRLYIMRRGDIFPMVLTLPPTALSAYDRYRTKVMLGRKKMANVMTRISLKSAQNKDGAAYSTPIFEAVGVLDGVEAAAMRAYSEALNGSAQRVGVTADDAPADVQQEAAKPTATVVDADAAAEVQAAFAEQDASQDDFAPLA